MTISCRDCKGFTLPELLVCMFCFSIILTAFTAFFLSSMKGYTAMNAQQDVQSSVVMGVDSIMRDFRETSKNTGEIFADCSSKHYFYFPSPRDWQNGNYCEHNEGDPWPSWILYYQTLDPKMPPGEESYVLVRNQQHDKPDAALIPSLDSGQIRGRIVSKSLKAFEVQADLASSPPRYKVSLDAKRLWKKSNYEFSLEKTIYVNDLHNI